MTKLSPSSSASGTNQDSGPNPYLFNENIHPNFKPGKNYDLYDRVWHCTFQEGKGTDEAIENRNYLAKRMTEEITEVIKLLEESAQTDNINKIMNAGLGGINLVSW